MTQIKSALVGIFWLMLASVPMILVGLMFVISAMYVSGAVLAALFLGVEALGPLPYILGAIAIGVGAGAILLIVRFVNRRDDLRFVSPRAPNPGAASDSSGQVAP